MNKMKFEIKAMKEWKIKEMKGQNREKVKDWMLEWIQQN